MGQVQVQILNPLPGGRQYTSQRSAEGFIRRGLAVRHASGAIEFVEQEKRRPRPVSAAEDRAVFDWRGNRAPGAVRAPGENRS